MINKNIELLAKLKGVTIKPEFNENLIIEDSKSGIPTAKFNNIYIHSKFNPEKEVEKLISNIEHKDLYILGGFGLGYVAEKLSEKEPNSYIVIYEPDITLFYTALKSRDLSKILCNKKIGYIFSNNPQEIKNFLDPAIVKKVAYIPLVNRERGFENEFDPVKKIVNLYSERIKVNRNTLLKFGELWVKNQIKNLPLLGYRNNLSDIFGKFSNIPGIIVSAGPSLELLIPHLKELKNKFLILSVDTALKSLLDEGVEPDFVMSIDSQFWNAKHLEGAKTSKSILIADSSIQPIALRPFKNRVYFIHSTFPLGKYFEEQRKEFPKIASGGSVSTTIWDFAKKLGLREIFFIGQDLGYPGNITHYKNSYFEKRMLISGNRLNPIENQSFKYIYDGYPNFVTNNSGDKIISDRKMEIYINWFKEKISLDNNKNTFNLSPNGCHIEGIEYRDLQNLLSYKNVRTEIIELLKSLNIDEPNFYKDNIYIAAVKFKKELELIYEYSNKALEICNNFKYNIQHNFDISKNISDLEDLDKKIISFSHSKKLSFIIEPFLMEMEEIPVMSSMDVINKSFKLYNFLKNSTELHIKHLKNVIQITI